MKRLLYLCQQNPWRLDSGGLIRNYWIVRGLATRFAIDLITADPVEPHDIPADFASVCASIDGVPRATGMRGRIARASGAFSLEGSFFTSDTVTGAMRERVRERVAAAAYAGAVFDLKAWPALRDLDVPIVYHGHNCEWKLLARRAAVEGGVRKLLVALDAQRVRRIEREVLERAKATFVCSIDDLNDLAELVPAVRANAPVAPNGVDVARYAPVANGTSDGRTILLTGSFDWRPNQQGAQWFVEAVLPALRARRAAGWEVRLAGRMTPDFVATVRAWGVTPVPNPAAMEPELQRAHIIAAPILASSGTRLRILEAWAAGRPVVTTHAGAFGLPYHDGAELFARDEAASFAQAIDALFESPARYAAMRTRALEVVAGYDWRAIGERLAADLDARL